MCPLLPFTPRSREWLESACQDCRSRSYVRSRPQITQCSRTRSPARCRRTRSVFDAVRIVRPQGLRNARCETGTVGLCIPGSPVPPDHHIVDQGAVGIRLRPRPAETRAEGGRRVPGRPLRVSHVRVLLASQVSGSQTPRFASQRTFAVRSTPSVLLTQFTKPSEPAHRNCASSWYSQPGRHYALRPVGYTLWSRSRRHAPPACHR